MLFLVGTFGKLYIEHVITVLTGITMMLLFSRHAREKMVARGISEGLVAEAIQRGSKHFQKPGKIVAEYRYFSVVYKKQGNAYFIVTVKPRW